MAFWKGIVFVWSFLCLTLPQVIAESSLIQGSQQSEGKNRIFYITTMFNRAPLFDSCLNSMKALAGSDPDMSWTVVNYGTPGRDVKQLLEVSGVPHQYISVESERFSRTLGLQRALDAIPEDDGLVFSLDLIHVPLSLPNLIRSNVVKGQKAFMPVMFQLDEGEAVGSSKGHWYYPSYGLIGFYKSDALRIGGYKGSNEGKINMHQWGCEDVNFAGSLAAHGLKAARMNVEGLQHVTLSQEQKKGLEMSLPEQDWARSYGPKINSYRDCLASQHQVVSATLPPTDPLRILPVAQSYSLELDEAYLIEADVAHANDDDFIYY